MNQNVNKEKNFSLHLIPTLIPLQHSPSIEAITEVGLSESSPAPAMIEAMVMRAKKSKVRWFPSSMTSCDIVSEMKTME